MDDLGNGSLNFVYVTNQKRAAWIIEWELHRRDLPIRDLHPYILPYRWQSDRIFDFMRCLYWNSALWTPSETLERVNRPKPQGVFVLDHGPRLIYGMSTVLVACRVKDLSICKNSAGKCVMEWTMPANLQIDRKALRVVKTGSPVKRCLVFKDWHFETECLSTD
ncbi:MAG: hypothetical protein WDM80_00870 [Limisphaerales bacterium]